MSFKGLRGALCGCPALILASVLVPTRGWAIEKASEQVTPFYGTFSYGVSIEAPPFRGLEPGIALSYSSEGPNGFLGVGWSLSGFSTIERANPGRGTPLFAPSDIFLLDGEELVPCLVGSVSPSCTSGGTHSTKIERYLKIQYTASTNSFKVWGKDGTRSDFAPILTVPPGPYTPGGVLRWGIAAVTDTSGNQAIYTWTCMDGDCYPQSVAYGSYSVTFYRESRPDRVSSAASSILSETRYRLRSVIVRLGSAYVRGYKLAYAVSPLTGRSLLASAQLYGNDLVQDGSGLITAGTALPAATFAYQEDALGKRFEDWAAPPTPPALVEPVTWANQVNVAPSGTGNSLTKVIGNGGNWDAGATSTRAIVSGDGYVQFAASQPTVAGKAVGLSTGNTDSSLADIDYALFQAAGGVLYAVERGTHYGLGSTVTGDTLRVEVTAGIVYFKKNGATLRQSPTPPVFPLRADASILGLNDSLENVMIAGSMQYVDAWCQAILLSGDFNGDQRTDQLCYTTTGSPTVRVALAGGLGFAPPTTWLSGLALSHPIVADFNNDGRADIAAHDPWSGAFTVATSTGSAFAAPVTWGTAAATGPSGAFLCGGEFPSTVGAGDFNGDGLTDVYCKSLARPENFVGISNGSSFTFAVWGQLGCDTFDAEVGAIDFDGNGMDDWYCIGAENDTFAVFTSSGSSFLYPAFGALDGSFCPGEDYILGDLNGDGRTDAACRANGKVALSTGRSFLLQGTHGGWCTGAVDKFATDIDGDGASELVCNAPGAGAADIQVRKWNGTALNPVESWRDSWCSGRVRAGDWNGDGKSDLYCASTASPALAGTNGRQADLVASIANGSGGILTVSYSPSSIFTHTNNPPVKQTVTSVTTEDGRGWSATTTYAYSGGLMDRRERRFLGFRYARTNLPCIAGEVTCPFSETWFRQDLPAAGSPETILRRDGAGYILSKQSFAYTVNDTTLPKTSLLTGETNYSYDSPGCLTLPCASEKQTTVSHEYNAYGERLRSIFQGDAGPGDEKTVQWTFQANPTAYIVALTQEEHLDHLGVRAAATRYGYDGQGWTLAPVKGRRTSSESYLDRENRWVSTIMAYEEPWGHQTTVTDPTSRVTTTAYDPIYHLFPQVVTNAALEFETTLWNPSCSAPSQHTDANGRVTTYQYDALCRLVRTDTPLSGFELRHYRDWNSPVMRRVVIETPPPSGSSPIFHATHIDGLGRPYMTVAKGPAVDRAIVSQIGFNGRGAVAWRMAPYYGGDPTYVTTYSYDALDRVASITHPDGKSISRTYDAWSQTTTDEEGTPSTVRFDAYGRSVASERSLNGQLVKTTSVFDSLGRMRQLKDPQNITWTWKYDSLGRNYETNDPDAGTSGSSFDDAGRKMTIVDAENQRIELAYNPGGRLATKKTYTAANVLTGTTTFNYSEPRSGQFNVGRLTSANGPGSISLQAGYDERGRMKWRKRGLDGQEFVATRTFDSGDRILSIQYPDGDTVGPLVYDDAGRLEAIPGIVSELLYDASGRMVQQTNDNGTLTTRSHDPERGFLQGITTQNPRGERGIQRLTYGYSDTGRLEAATSIHAQESWTYTYDPLYRLESATNVDTPSLNQTWVHDISGRMTYNSRVGSYVYPPVGAPRPHGPTLVGPDSFTYRPNGNVSSGGGRTFTWNVSGLPTQVNTTQFVYGGLDERVKKVDGASTTLYPLGDDYEIVNGVVTKYISVEGLGLLAKRTNVTLCPPAGTCWLHLDRMGSVHVETDGNGLVVQRRKYMPYGEKISDATTHPESLGWIGERFDAEIGLMYLHARYYDPVRGLFASPDPIGPAGGLNSYGYALGDPINNSDPSGLSPTPTSNYYVCYPWCGGGGRYPTFPVGVVGRGGPGSYRPGGGPAIGVNPQFIADWLNGLLDAIFGGRRQPPNPNRRPGYNPNQLPPPGTGCTGPNCGAVPRGPQPQPVPTPTQTPTGTPNPNPTPAPAPPTPTPGPTGPAPTPPIPGPVPVPTPPGTGGPAPVPAPVPTGPNGARIPQGVDRLNPVHQYLYFDNAYRRFGHARFPGERNEFMRHCTMTCEVARDYGSTAAQMIGFINEVQGFISIDMERANPESTPATAVELEDMLGNEFGRAYSGIEGVPCESHCRHAPRP